MGIGNQGSGRTSRLALHDIAKREGIRYLYRLLPNDPKLSGELIYKGNKKGILINTHISSPKRHTFTFAHELGHYFLEHKPEYVRDGRTGFWCTVDDVLQGKRQKEQEANAFAVELLMPEDQFRTSMAGAPFDFTLINSLAREYQVSKQTCGYRILELTQSPCAILHSELVELPCKGLPAPHMDFTPVDAYSTSHCCLLRH